MHPLRAIGLTATAEDVYLALVQRGPTTSAALAGILRVPPGAVGAAAGELSGLGLVEPDGGRFVARPPRAALDALAEIRAKELGALRDSADELSRFWRDHHAEGPGYIEIVRTEEAREALARRVQDEAVHQVRALSIGPSGRLAAPPEVAPGCLEALARGVAYSVVYGARVLRDPIGREAIQTCVNLGERARVFPNVALNLMICDDRFAVVAAPARDAQRRHHIAVQRSALLDGLIGVFEAYWQMAVPLPAGDEVMDDVGAAPTDDARQLLTYLSGGLTDESIAREFGVSERTVARRIARLQEVLGAQTRFQLGVQASRRGWL
ncbi:LuxR C-terminal-related transcriptional regulator [Streptomyces sp. NBC_00873]|uniref:LuxR family transcriptional regulator n=1 Tax=unclassified Streptomyces TaxID=2593676 RepID=UPI003866BD30|nr:LuxR C-terminal-related transcriptional regulator [Streptomyces sp. NBC_00873]WTA47929.1 LuxR C-terminal-related transcriptional regulator [Streptomyces sp. NBC_00842]